MRPPPISGSCVQCAGDIAPALTVITNDLGSGTVARSALIFLHVRRKSPVETDHQQRPIVLGGDIGDGSLDVCELLAPDRQRFFDKDVPARPQRLANVPRRACRVASRSRPY